MSTEATDLGLRRAPRITADDVFAAADALLVDGHRPTIDRVRMKLGRGSPNTINEHLDHWWSNLGARLRDLPGQVLPELPESVTNSLLQLWNLAVRESHAALLESLQAREAALAAANQDVEQRVADLRQQEQARLARAGALEDGLTLAREQLTAANRRAEALEAALREREVELGRLQQRAGASEDDVKTLRTQLDTERLAHRSERAQGEERHAAAQARWLQEVDRARQTSKERERQLKELRTQLQAAQREGAQLSRTLTEVRAELKAGALVRAQLERRLSRSREMAEPAATAAARRRKPAKAGRHRPPRRER